MTTISVVKVNGLTTSDYRSSVCYVGRRWAGWPETQWGNPFKPDNKKRFTPQWFAEVAKCIEKFEANAAKMPDAYFADLWAACEQGAKPLGCWCVTATHGDGQPVVCHAQVLAAMLHERFVEGAAK